MIPIKDPNGIVIGEYDPDTGEGTISDPRWVGYYIEGKPVWDALSVGEHEARVVWP